MLAAASSFVGLTEKSSEFSSVPPMSKFSVGTAVETPVVGNTGWIAVDTAAASSIAAAPSLRTAMITSELPPGIPANPATAML